MKLKAIGDRVILKQKEKETVTESGIILEYSHKHEFDRAYVESAGPKCDTVKAGDLVTFIIKDKDFGKIEDKSGEPFIILREDQISAVILEE